MNRAALTTIAVVAIGLLFTAPKVTLASQAIPAAPTQFVTDRIGFLTEPTRATLDARLTAYQQRTGHQVIVYIDGSTGGVPIEDWAVRAFAAWRVGRQQLDDGLALFIFRDDRRTRIEVGYGLEPVVTDAFASRVIRETIAPKILANDHDGAVTGAVDRLLAAIDRGGPDSAAPPTQQTSPLRSMSPVRTILMGLFALFVLILAIRHPWIAWMILSGLGRGGGGGGGDDRGGGGGFSGGGGRSGGGGASGGW